MRGAIALTGVLIAPLLAGCGSSTAEEGKQGQTASERVLQAFYAAANVADGRRACGYLTDSGIRQVVRVASRTACVRTIGGFSKGSFAPGKGALVDIEHLEQHGDEVEVEAEVKGRSGGTYRLVERHGRLLIDGFEPEER